MTASSDFDSNDYPAPLRPPEFADLTARWGSAVTAGDPGACMYGFDEAGLVQDEDHRAACLAWIADKCRPIAASGDDPEGDLADLDRMEAYLKGAPSLDAPPPDLDAFTQAYVATALWSTTDNFTPDGGEPFDANYDVHHIHPATLAVMISDCRRFQEENAHLLKDKFLIHGDDAVSRAGHDFWLTRNRHGAGFWDGDWVKKVGKALTQACEAFGEVDLYVGDDCRIHDSSAHQPDLALDATAEPDHDSSMGGP